LNFRINLSQNEYLNIFNKIINKNIEDLISNNLISYYFTTGNLINLYNFSRKNNVDLVNITLKDFLLKIIDENYYKKEILNLDLIYTFIQMYLVKNEETRNNYELYTKFIKSIENIKRFNLDIESFFIQFRRQLTND
jgi:DNA polymerase-3 subunit delta'